MIDKLPLDLFGKGEPESEPAEPNEPPAATCPWCSAAVTIDATDCPECGARILRAEPAPDADPAEDLHEGICRWCGATIAPDDDICPECGWDARGDSEIEMPGITTPLSESAIRSLYGGDEEPELDPTEAVALAAEVISLILPRD
jgi:ribosomal protein L40E